MAGTTVDLLGTLFVNYLPGVTETLRVDSSARRIPLGTKKWEGSQLQWTLHVGHNEGVGAVGDGGPIPTPSYQRHVSANIKRKYVTASAQISDGALATAKTSRHAAEKVVDTELKRLFDVIHKHDSYFFTRDGSGVVTLLGADPNPSGGTISVDDARGLWDNCRYVVHDSTSVPGTPVTHYEFVVTSTARALTTAQQATVTVTPTTANTTAAADDYVVWKGGLSGDSFGLNPAGLDKMIDDDTSATFQGVTTSTYTRYTSPVLDANSTSLTMSLLHRMMAMIAQESGKNVGRGEYSVVTNNWSMRKFNELSDDAVRITPMTSTIGSKAMSFTSAFGQFTLEPLWDAPYGKMFFVDRKQISRAVQRELGWRKSDGGGILTKSSNSLVYTADLLEILDFCIDDRRSCGKIENLSETIDTAY
jgi:hypothetical protein